MFLILFISVSCGVILILIRYSLWRQKYIQLIPGNQLSFFNIFGDLKEILAYERSNDKYAIHHHAASILGRMSQQHREKKLFCFWVCYKPIICLVKADAVKEFLKEKKMFEKSSLYDSAKIMIGTGLLISPVEKWKSRRKLLNICFHHDMLKEYLVIFNKNSQKLVEFFQQETKNNYSDVKKHINDLSLDIICETLFGTSVGALGDPDSQYSKSFSRIAELFMSRIYKFWQWPDFLFKFTSAYREGMQHVKLFQDLANSVIQEREKYYSSNSERIARTKRKVLIDTLLELHFETQELTKDDVMEEVLTFLMAGHETISFTLIWALYLIGLHPKVQEKIHEELDNVFGEDLERKVTEEDLCDLKYLSCVLQETNRLYTIVPVFGREILEDTVISDYPVPKGASCFILAYFLHRDETVFPDPEKFDPDRFLPENAAKIPEGAYVPFSAGPRNCIGQRFADIEMKTILSSILRHYNFHSLDPRDKVLPVMNITLNPSTDVRIRIRPRQIGT
ncbi:cytochrome P450 4V2 [Nephila pilipes]|uniref:Cytochrome P450 4V2 n=1 Tax=Nephila pilipes TaxID=299642 RepID=A0A8X6TD27_NEPPI|nr:cytochrome P450 4V2 [Nephila pilipes]